MKKPQFAFENPKTVPVKEEHVEVKVLDGQVSKVETTITPLNEDKREQACQDKIVELKDRVFPYRGIDVDSKEDALLPEMSMIEGSPWVVEYFQQYLGKDDEPAAFSNERLSPYQQYRRIRNLELRLSGSLSYSHDEEYSNDELTGSAYVYGVIRPNQGDMIIADIGDGRTGLIEIDKVRRLSHRKYTNYEIEFHVRDYLKEEDHRNLIEKSIDTVVFIKERLVNGASPFVDEVNLDALAAIESNLHRLPQIYFSQFYDDDASTLLVPVGTGVRVYDVDQMAFVNAIIDKMEFPRYRNLKLLRTESLGNQQEISLWDALLQRDWYLIDEVMTKFNFVARDKYRGPGLQFNAFYGTVDYFIHQNKRIKTAMPLIYSERFTAPAELPIFIEEDTTSNRRYIYGVGKNNDYVFSDYFYCEDLDKMSRLEKQVYNYLKGLPICPNEICRLMQASVRWDDIDRYYYIPILLLLGKALVLGFEEV